MAVVSILDEGGRHYLYLPIWREEAPLLNLAVGRGQKKENDLFSGRDRAGRGGKAARQPAGKTLLDLPLCN